jgi:uncharacterized protein YjiS (DUF1127 family)
MQSNQKAALVAVRPAEGQVFARTRAALANSARSFQTRQQVSRELALLSDRALADLGLYRCDIASFSRDASRIEGAENLLAAIAADLKALLGSHGAAGAAGHRI